MQEITQIREKQLRLTRLLEGFRRICEEKGLTFWLSNGTLLGAVKYGGFIPWDDDVDIMMPREDYDRFVALTAEDTAPWQLICREQTPGWKYPYAKLTDPETLVREGEFDLGAEYGLFLDIFPVDSWVGNYRLACLQARYCGLLCRFLYTSTSASFQTRKRGLKRGILWGIYLFSKTFGSEVFCRGILGQARRGRQQKTAPYIGSICWAPYGVREVLDRTWFDTLTQVRFEGNAYPAPGGYEQYLTRFYGDYRKDPPPEKQKSNHAMRVWIK